MKEALTFMILEPCAGGVFLYVTVKTGARKFHIIQNGEKLIANLASRPERNRANIELVSELEDIFHQPVFLVSGQKSKSKKLKINNITAEEAMQNIAGIAEYKKSTAP